jgi:urease accessory protein
MNARLRSLTALLQLASPALPVGAYSYSQGLEAAVDAGIVRDAAGAARWIGDVLSLSLQGMEAPLFLRLAAAWKVNDAEAAGRWNAEFVASRESAELRAETLQMGYSLRNLLRDLGEKTAPLEAIEDPGYPTAFAFAVVAWNIDAHEALAAYLFAWTENQVIAALKSVPLGQTDGQRILRDLARRIPDVVESASKASDEELSNFAPGLAILSARHETQYSRIFRS